MDPTEGWIPGLIMAEVHRIMAVIRMFFSGFPPFHMQRCDPKLSLLCIVRTYDLLHDI